MNSFSKLVQASNTHLLLMLSLILIVFILSTVGISESYTTMILIFGMIGMHLFHGNHNHRSHGSTHNENHIHDHDQNQNQYVNN